MKNIITKRRIYLLFQILLFSLLALTSLGCQESEKNDIFYDDEIISRRGDSYTYFSRTGSIDHLNFKGFSGAETIYSASEDIQVSLMIDYSITRGKFKVVYIDYDYNVVILERGQSYDLTLSEYERIKIVGDSAYGLLEVEINEIEE